MPLTSSQSTWQQRQQQNSEWPVRCHVHHATAPGETQASFTAEDIIQCGTYTGLLSGLATAVCLYVDDCSGRNEKLSRLLQKLDMRTHTNRHTHTHIYLIYPEYTLKFRYNQRCPNFFDGHPDSIVQKYPRDVCFSLYSTIKMTASSNIPKHIYININS